MKFIITFILSIINCQSITVNDFHNISLRKYLGKATVVTENEYRKISKCSFVALDCGSKSAICSLEGIEHQLVRKNIKQNARVLELGARYGTTSCVLANQIGNSGMLVSVEPDSTVWESLEINIDAHNCSMYIVKFPIGDSDIEMKLDSYGTRGIPLPPSPKSTIDSFESKNKRHFSYNEIQDIVGFKFTALLIDCEGCIRYLFGKESIKGQRKSLQYMLRYVDTIILEGDMGKNNKKLVQESLNYESNKLKSGKSRVCHECVDYDKWEKIFVMLGFRVQVKIQDKLFKDIYHYVFKRQL